ncbi:RNA polymerase sigma factor [Microbacterium sp.]|uniref:RNA polymerase sigma factor n=1 Tax=Microbacterium sp. TaxID=51671 RepID=UPI003A877C4C
MDPTEERTDRELVAAAASGSESAFRALYRAYVRPVYWLAHGLLGAAADAEEVTQETFLTAWRKLPELVLESESLLPWLVTICRFQSANRVRRLARDRAHTLAAVEDTLQATSDVEGQVIAARLADRILTELAGLAEIDREIFRLCAVEGDSYQSAAQRLGISHGAVRNRLSRVRDQLRTTVRSEEA